MNAVLKVDPEFESICPVLTNDEYLGMITYLPIGYHVEL